jgi:hypothetical protein
MSDMSDVLPGGATPRLRELALGFAYWLAFVLVLEPDNLLREWQAAGAIPWVREAARLCAAGLLGAVATPPILAFTRRFPVEGAAWPKRLALQAAGSVVAAVGLVGLSVVLARWAGLEARPLPQALGEELIANGPLLVAATAGLMLLAYGVRRLHRGEPAKREAAGYLTHLPVRSRGRTTLVALDEVDWIETQGNYLALHAGPAEHLVRESLSALEPRLDPRRFVRIHRRVLVAADRVAEITGIGAGDAALRLRDGTELRLSRSYRDRLGALTSKAP